MRPNIYCELQILQHQMQHPTELELVSCELAEQQFADYSRSLAYHQGFTAVRLVGC